MPPSLLPDEISFLQQIILDYGFPSLINAVIALRPFSTDTVCPICRSEDVDVDAPDEGLEEDEIVRDANCLDCKAEWQNVYRLVKYEVDNTGDYDQGGES